MRLLIRSEEHTSELQSHDNLVCRLLLEKKEQREEVHGWRHRTHHPRREGRAQPAPLRASAAPGTGCAPALDASPDAPAVFFFFKDRATPEISPFPLPAALPF